MTTIRSNIDRYAQAAGAFASSPDLQRVALALAEQPRIAAYIASLAEAMALAAESPDAFNAESEELRWLGQFVDGLLWTDRKISTEVLDAFELWRAWGEAQDAGEAQRSYDRMYDSFYPQDFTWPDNVVVLR